MPKRDSLRNHRFDLATNRTGPAPNRESTDTLVGNRCSKTLALASNLSRRALAIRNARTAIRAPLSGEHHDLDPLLLRSQSKSRQAVELERSSNGKTAGVTNKTAGATIKEKSWQPNATNQLHNRAASGRLPAQFAATHHLSLEAFETDRIRQSLGR